MSARKKIYDHMKENGIRGYPLEELKEISGISDWPRVLRQLKQDEVINYEHSKNTYHVTEINGYKKNASRSALTRKDRYRIGNRDGHRCQACGMGTSDGVKLHVDHKIPVDCGGGNDDDNLWILCAPCNLGKKAFFKDDLDSEVMKVVFQLRSGCQKLKTLFELSPNRKYTPAILQGIAGIRDWTRTIRHLREKDEMNILWHEKSADYPNGYYVNEV